MSDVFSKAKRSEVMSRIRSQGNRKTELKLVKILKTAGVTGWRRHQKLIGRPDFIFRAEKIAVFVDGCFWHACPRCYRAPTSNREYWTKKRLRNSQRDKIVGRQLKQSGWNVVRIWEHELRSSTRVLKRIERVLQGK
jgi:DNA mismatch endonuclease, patch repair protein